MLRISDLVRVPPMEEGVARRYSEGCFATWGPELQALVATATGSARPLGALPADLGAHGPGLPGGRDAHPARADAIRRERPTLAM